MADTCKMTVNVFGGNRQLIPAGTEVLLTVRDGNQKDYQLPNNGYFHLPTVTIDGIPFFDNFGDQYAVVAWVTGFQQAGFHPVTINPKVHSVVDIMLAKTNAQYDFSQAGWPQLKQNYPSYAALLGAGVPDDASAASRYQSLLTNREDVLACYFNLVTAMSQIHLPVQTPLFYLKELIWGDDTMKQDRFFAWADLAILDQMVRAEQAGMFAPEMGASLFHDGATRSWKEVQFGEANVQLTFHENDRNPAHPDWVKIEPDIDYYKDLAAHFLLEVAVNGISHTLTDPRQVYVLRWMAGRQALIPAFEPPYTLG